MNHVYINGKLIDHKRFVFPGGEVSVKLNHSVLRFTEPDNATILSNCKNSDDLFEIALLKDALQREGFSYVNLFLPYVPYARQDRVCDKGESLSIKVFADFINSILFDKVTICDPHSEVPGALLDRVQIIDQVQLINHFSIKDRALMSGCLLLSPDAGANKKTAKLASFFGHRDFIRADKKRELSTGNILETIVYYDDLKGVNVLCVDDIGDGMRTFIELSKVLKAKNCGKFYVYVTHGIFSKGVEICFENGIEGIFTTNSLYEGVHPKVQVLDLGLFLNSV